MKHGLGLHTCDSGHDEVAYYGGPDSCPACSEIASVQQELEDEQERFKELENDFDENEIRLTERAKTAELVHENLMKDHTHLLPYLKHHGLKIAKDDEAEAVTP